jgi:hypothetical protein
MARKRSAKPTRPSRSPGFRDVGFRSRDLPAAMTEVLEQQHRLQLVIKWTKSRSLVLMSLQVRKGGLWTELLDHPVGNNSGEIVFEMGIFPPGKLSIRFLIGALMEIPKAATFIVEDDQQVSAFKPAAGQPPKALKQGEQWADKGDYAVGETS